MGRIIGSRLSFLEYEKICFYIAKDNVPAAGRLFERHLEMVAKM